MINDLIEIQQQKRRGLTLIGSQLYKKGLTLYEINLSTKEIKVAEYSENYWNPIEKKGTRKLNVNPNCVYRQFLNLKNCQRFVAKM
jgi:hypothetical protein